MIFAISSLQVGRNLSVSEFVQWKSSLRGLFLSLENACKGTSRDCELVDIWSEMAVLMDMWWSPAVTGFFFLAPKSSAVEIYLQLAEVCIRIVFSWECCAKHGGERQQQGCSARQETGNTNWSPSCLTDRENVFIFFINKCARWNPNLDKSSIQCGFHAMVKNFLLVKSGHKGIL